ncbi:hypothetical protein [Streptomyces sp. A0592]|uniref:hypothetical protein n=1 Tax=Streptomyces sp. A0592 TaxID=2563099 RepID=UPI00109E960F|nr:hypothetical protein [Streptomyces sp. A0592]THA81256.1 hypothetical protein E6U81_25840 [Streptomyces sp. A0592]
MTTHARDTAAAATAEAEAEARVGAPAGRRPVPHWAVRAAHAVPLCVLPSGLWRVALVLGPAGHNEDHRWAAWERPYAIGLSVVCEGLALLALGLVRPWGEAVPRCVTSCTGTGARTRSGSVAAVTTVRM